MTYRRPTSVRRQDARPDEGAADGIARSACRHARTGSCLTAAASRSGKASGFQRGSASYFYESRGRSWEAEFHRLLPLRIVCVPFRHDELKRSALDQLTVLTEHKGNK